MNKSLQGRFREVIHNNYTLYIKICQTIIRNAWPVAYSGGRI